MAFSKFIKYLMLILLLTKLLVSCQQTTAKSSKDLLFCADQSVYSESISPDGKTQTNKILDLPENATCPVWSPDGRLALLYRFKQNGLTVEDSLNIIDRQTGSVREVYRFGERDSEWTIRWKPDGISLLLASARDYKTPNPCSTFTERTLNGIACWSSIADLYLADISQQGGLDHFDRLTTSPSARCSLAWSPDGQKLAFAHGNICTEGSISDGNIDILDINTREVTNPIKETPEATDPSLITINSSPEWSPIGDNLLFSSLQIRGSILTRQIFVADGLHVHTILPNDVRPLVWSPAGKKIVWVGDSLGVTNIESDQFQDWSILKDSLFRVSQRSWSPDEQHFVWSEWDNHGDRKELRAIDLASNKIITLVSLLAQSWAWSPDGEWLAFSARTPTDSGTCEYIVSIYVVKPDGTGLHNLTEGQRLRSLQCGPQGLGWKWYEDAVSDVQWVSR